MKKLIFLVILVLAFVTLEAQIATKNIATGKSQTEYTTDVTLTNAVAQYLYIISKQHTYTAQCLVVQLDTGAAGNHTNVALQLQGRYTTADAWANVGSAINWKVTTADTTIVYLNATENGYRQWKVLFTGTGTGTSTIDNIFFKQYLYGTP